MPSCKLKEFIPIQLARDVEADALGQLSDVGDLDAGDGPAGDGAADAGLPTDPNLGQDQFLSQLERGAVKKCRTPKRPAGGTRRRTATEEEDVLKDIQDSMKVSTGLLSQLVNKSDQGALHHVPVRDFEDTPRGSVPRGDEAYHISPQQSSSSCGNSCAAPAAVFIATAVPIQPARELLAAAVPPPNTDLPAGTQHHLPPDNPGVDAAPVHADDTVDEHPIYQQGPRSCLYPRIFSPGRCQRRAEYIAREHQPQWYS